MPAPSEHRADDHGRTGPPRRFPWQRQLQTRIVLTFGSIFGIVLLLLMIRINTVLYRVQLDQAEHGLEVEAFLAANALEDPLSGYGSEFEAYEQHSDGDEGHASDSERDDTDHEDDAEHSSEDGPTTPSAVVAPELIPGPVTVRLQQLAEWYAADAGIRVTILSPEGDAIADSHFAPTLVENQLAEVEIQAAAAGTEQHAIRIEPLTGQETLFAAAPIQQGERQLGFVQLARPMADVLQPIRTLQLNMITASVLALALLTIAGIALARRLVKPVRNLERAAIDIAAGDLSRRAPLETGDEIGELAIAFNTMVDQLRMLIEQQRVFIANASHELRTPLTNIKLRSEALRVMDLTADQAVATRFIGEIDTEADRLGRMATTLLDLSRLEAQTTDLPAPPLDIAPLLLDMSRVIGVRMRAAALTYRARIPTQLPPIHIAPADMEEILANLLDNAIKYTPASGTVQLDAVADGARVQLVIADSGLGIPADDLPSIFDRFYRVDKARSRKAGGDSVGSGAGLGLFLVKTLVERNGGTIVAASSPGAGTTFTVHFPLAVFD